MFSVPRSTLNELATQVRRKQRSGNCRHLCRFCLKVDGQSMASVEVPREPQQAAPKIEWYFGSNEQQHHPVQKRENSQHDSCCRWHFFIFTENTHRCEQNRRQQHNFIRQPAIGYGQDRNHHHSEPVIAPRPFRHVLQTKPNAPNETQQHRNELRSEIRPEKYEPQYSAHRGNEFTFDRSCTQHLSVMLKSTRIENQRQNSRHGYCSYKTASDCELFVRDDPKKEG